MADWLQTIRGWAETGFEWIDWGVWWVIDTRLEIGRWVVGLDWSQAPKWAPVVTATVVVASASLAYWSIKAARATAREKATLDLIEKAESTPHYRELYTVFRKCRVRKDFARLTAPSTPEEIAERGQIMDYLNHYELVAIGIRKRILDEKFYASWMMSTYLREWNAAADFIQRLRWRFDEKTGEWRYDHRIYDNFERQAYRWSVEAKRIGPETSKPPEKPASWRDHVSPGLGS